MSRPSSRFQSLLRTLRSLPELAMRREVLAERLVDLGPEESLAFLAEVVAGIPRRQPLCLCALEAVGETIASAGEKGPLYELLSDTYRLARERELPAVVNLFVSARAQRGPVAREDLPVDPDLLRLPLGERKFLARGHNPLRLQRLLKDPDPAVLVNLLRNPSITEREVVNLAARRPTREDLQWEVHRSRFGQRYRVRLALAQNPYSPPELVLKIIGFILKKDLRRIAGDGGLHPRVRAEAQRILEEKAAKNEPATEAPVSDSGGEA
ncbi:MAG: hypothetical protein GYA21_10280 [Myxococcales bacterium]|nr:hypothetical protein [Myxococcales bacterium]